ncbi:MAG: integrase arm-type DNA-binding domain-containing protein [Methylobacillus sp.]|jgi:integrase|nr:integrase arm-type DNA-binding domain-containing protein [Methylobacillus sp.]
MALTDTAVRNAKPDTKPYKLSDEKGLFVLVHPNGSKYFRFKYRFGGKEKTLALGVYPDVGLSDARNRRDDARKLLANGVDPSELKQQTKHAQLEAAANSFEAVALEWLAKHKHTWAESNYTKLQARLQKDVLPWLGKRPIADIKAPELLAVLRRAESRGALDTAKRIRQTCGQIFRYAVATGRAERDISPDLKDAIPPTKVKHLASITEPAKVGELLRAFDAFQGTFTVQCALRLAPMFFARPGELRKARWTEFDLDKAEWKYIATKTKTEHLVPLAPQAVAILHDLHALTGGGEYVFPGRDPNKPMSNAAVNAALRRMGYNTKTEITAHGFRAMARTMLAQELHQQTEVIEHQLAHRVPDALGTAYNRTKFLKERRAMMVVWASYLDGLKAGADIIPFRGTTAA